MDFLCSTCEMPKLFLLSTSVLTTIKLYSVWIQHPWHHLTSDRSYHNDLCILSVAFIWNYWLKQESWLGRKCYLSRVNNILQILCQKRWAVWISVGSWAIKLLHEIPISVSWSAGSSYAFSHVRNTDHCLRKKERIHLFSNHSNNQGENLWITSRMLCMHSPILLPGWFFSPTRKSIVVNIIKMTATYLLKPFNFKVFIDFWPWCVWELHVTLAKVHVNKLAYFMTD